MKAALACIVSAALTVGCKGEADPSGSETAQVEQSTEVPRTEPNLRDASGEEPAAPESPMTEEQRVDATVDPVQGEASPYSMDADHGALEGEDNAALPRDLAGELTDAMGTPYDCIKDFERATPTTIRVTVSALVRSSGVLIQATAAGAGLSSQARQCIARRAETVVLQPLEGDESQRVSTVIEIDYEPPSSLVKKAQAGAPDPELRNVREPLPKRPEVEPSGRPIQEPTSRPIQEPTSRPIQEPSSRKIRGPKPRPIDGWDVDESAKEWR